MRIEHCYTAAASTDVPVPVPIDVWGCCVQILFLHCVLSNKYCTAGGHKAFYKLPRYDAHECDINLIVILKNHKLKCKKFDERTIKTCQETAAKCYFNFQ